MQRVTTYIILAAVFFSGALLVYRSAIEVRQLNKVEAKVIAKNVEPVYEHKGKTYYALTFTLDGQRVKPGIYNGTEAQHELLSEVDTGMIYTFFMDPAVDTANNLDLGVREIRSHNKIIYKESNRSSWLGGLALLLIASVAALLFWRYNKRVKVPLSNA